MANTYTLIASSTASGSVASIDFTSIPSTYTDLVIKYSIRSDTAATGVNLLLKFNGSTTTYSARNLEGSGSSASSGTFAQFAGVVDGASATASTFSNSEIYIPNYAGANNKSYSGDTVSENNSSTGNWLELIAGLWATGSAITSISLLPSSGTLSQYSTAYLYGVKNA